MSILFARTVVDRVGPRRLVHVGARDGGALTVELSLHGVFAQRAEAAETADFDTVVLDLHGPDPAPLLTMVLQAFDQAESLVLLRSAEDRPAIDRRLFAAGWRRHPAGLLAHEYEGLSDARLSGMGLYQRIPAAAAARWPAAEALDERRAWTDPMRDTGASADAHIARYALAAQYVRPGDRVLDCASGLGGGTAVLATLSRGGTYVGVDPDPEAVAYAQANYGGRSVSFRPGDPAMLDGFADASVDVIVSTQSLQHAPDWRAVLAAFQRVLKPDGRVICSAPAGRTDPRGANAVPPSLQTFDWATLAGALGEHFILEGRFNQSAPTGGRTPDAPRTLRKIAAEEEAQADWLLAVASANPFAADDALIAGYRHPDFGASSLPLVDFAGSYENPYLYRTLIQMGERLSDDEKLIRLALLVVENARAGSPDRGGAIAVLGYRVLESRSLDDVDKVIALIEDYAAADDDGDVHTLRWRLSLAFLAARLMEMTGDAESALSWYARTAAYDWRGFSPLLATKTVAAAFYEGRLRLHAGDEAAARACFQRGVAEAMAASRSSAEEVLGDVANPLPFGLQELAEVIDMGSQCATALRSIALWKRSPGLFAQQIDTRRFGLASWAKDLEAENRRLLQTR